MTHASRPNPTLRALYATSFSRTATFLSCFLFDLLTPFVPPLFSILLSNYPCKQFCVSEISGLRVTDISLRLSGFEKGSFGTVRMGAKSSGNSPCASCKLLRRRCAKDCIFAPYFPPEEPLKFASVHKVFGASNVSKMLQELPVHQREDAVKSMVYEANARIRDPVYGCVGAISYLQQQVAHLQMQLAMAQAEILCMHIKYHESPQAQAPLNSNKNKNFDSNYMMMEEESDVQILSRSSYPQPSDCSATSGYSLDEHHRPHAANQSSLEHLMDVRDYLWT